MEWLQDQLLRLAARYYCQDMDIDASKLQIEKWDAESCRIKATDLKLTNEHGALSAAECTVDVSQGVAIETQGTILIAAPWRSIGAVMTDGWRGPAVSLQAAILELRCGGAKLRVRNAAITTNTTDSTANWDVAVASFHNDHVGEARGVSATLATRVAIGERRCDSTTRKLAKAEVEVVGGDTGLIMDTPLYALIEEAAPYLKKVGEEGLFCAFKCSRFVVRVLGIDVLGEAGIHLHLVDDDVWPRWRCDIQAPALRWGADDAPAASTMRISWLTREGWALACERGSSSLNDSDGYDDACARSPREPPGWRHPNFIKKPVLDGGPALRIDVKVDGSLSDAGLCYAVLGALWGGAATKAPSYTCTLRIEALSSSLGASEKVVATVARQSMTSDPVATLALKALRGAIELIGSEDAPVVARTGAPGEIRIEAAQGTLYTVPSLPNLRVTASLKSLLVPDVFGLALSACDATMIVTEDVLQGRAASLGITLDGLRLATLRGVGAERALLNGGVVQRARVSVDAVSIEMDGAGKAAGVLRDRAGVLRGAPKPADAPRAVALQARVEAAACGSLAATKLAAEVKVVDGAAEASLGDAEHGVLMRSTRGGVEVVSHDYVDDMAGTAAGRAVATLLAAAMEFAF
ncbi:unnamed protein product [Pelagomonas calceolata]|uniref:Uncharacterized protein n=1 Tax=Pelagomonas calceolata TaxID=35677 RepID=A0A8J2X1S8_9STRA|nr:unnamed protein product [Pelagomonas calceolata]